MVNRKSRWRIYYRRLRRHRFFVHGDYFPHQRLENAAPDEEVDGSSRRAWVLRYLSALQGKVALQELEFHLANGALDQNLNGVADEEEDKLDF